MLNMILSSIVPVFFVMALGYLVSRRVDGSANYSDRRNCQRQVKKTETRE